MFTICMGGVDMKVPHLGPTVTESLATPMSMYLDDAGNDKLFHRLLLSLVCWLMLARRLCVYNVG